MKVQSYKRKTSISLILAILLLVVNIYFVARPISYGLGYYVEQEYEGFLFEGTIQFNTDGTMLTRNTNFSQELEARYYYKDGYIFYVAAETDEEYQEEVSYINENFEEARNAPFYADKINAFQLVVEEADGYRLVYTCRQAIFFAIVGAVMELALAGLACANWLLCKKAMREV